MTSDPTQPHAVVKAVGFAARVSVHGAHEQWRARVPGAVPARCLRLEMPNPTGNQPEDENPKGERLREIVALHFEGENLSKARKVIDDFIATALDGKKDVATDQLLNAVYFVLQEHVRPTRSASASSPS
jgi:hypothetical protein